MGVHHNPNFIHHRKNTLASSTIREIIFGMEDGMVSTMGAVTGIAVGTQNHFVVILSGLVIIAVESISMAVGSYLSSKSEKEIDERKLAEEKIELRRYPDEEQTELTEMYVHDGWPAKLAGSMAKAARANKKLFLQEMAYRELKIFPEKMENPLRNGVAMGVSYILGGAIPLVPYLLTGYIQTALPISIFVTLFGLFALGVATTAYSKRLWWKAGLEMLILAGLAAGIGYLVGRAVDLWWLK